MYNITNHDNKKHPKLVVFPSEKEVCLHQPKAPQTM